MRQPKHNPEKLPLPLLTARRRSLRKKHRSSRVAKLPRKLKKELKATWARGWSPADVRIESYGWVTQQVEWNEWESRQEVGFDIPKTYGRFYGAQAQRRGRNPLQRRRKMAK